MRILKHLPRPRLVRVSVLTLLFLVVLSLCEGATLKGVVTNKTTNKPDIGDDVVLVALTQNMQDVARTKTDSDGRYSIELPDAGMHLIRVAHQKAAYFAAVAPGKTTVDVDVYDVEARLEGVTTEADMLRVEADPQGLHVIESYFVKNNSSPPRTQFGPKAYKIFLPAGAQIEASVAMGPGGMPVASPPVPSGDKGDYAFIFPVRPGETRFQVSYHLPYSGSYTFQPRVSLPTANLAVALPKSMKFAAGAGAPFQPLDDSTDAQTFVARNVQPSQPLAFLVSGNGALPRDSSQGQESQNQQTATSVAGPATDTRPGIGLGAPIDTPDPLDKYKWWLLTALGLIFVIAAAFFLRAKGTPPSEPVGPEGSPPTGGLPGTAQMSWLTTLKDQMFLLETERIQGKVIESDYQEQKAAFETMIRRALLQQKHQVSRNDRGDEDLAFAD